MRYTDLDGAVRMASRAKLIAKAKGWKREEAFARYSECITVSRRDVTGGLTLATEAAEFCLNAGYKDLAAGCLLTQNWCLFMLGAVEQGIERLHLAVELAEEASDWDKACLARQGLCSAFLTIQDLDKAEELMREALTLSAEKGVSLYLPTLLCGLGEVISRKGDDLAAIDVLSEAIPLAAESGRTDLAAEACTWHAHSLRRLGLCRESLEILERGLVYAAETCMPHAVFEVLIARAEHHLEAGDPEGSLDWALEARQAADQAVYRTGVPRAIHVMALALAACGRHEEAFEQMQLWREEERKLFGQTARSRMQALEILHQTERVKAQAAAAEERSVELEKVNFLLHQALASRDAVQRELERLASVDELTGLWNRREFMKKADHLLSTCLSEGRNSCLLMMDLDRFKSINDTLGHQAGDDALRSFAAAVRPLIGQGMAFGRIGGEEFAILMESGHDKDALDLGERLLEAARTSSFSQLDHGWKLTTSIGISSTRLGCQTLSQLLSEADQALYRSKSGGRDRRSWQGDFLRAAA